MENRTDDVIEIDLLELLRELMRRWILIAISTVLTAAIAFSYSKLLVTPQYESTSALYVLSTSTSITSLADIQIGTNLTHDYIVVIKGRPVLDQVIENLDLNLTYAQLNSKVSVNNPSDSRILEITVRDANPVVAKTIADEIAVIGASFIAENMGQDLPSIIQYGYSDEGKVSPSVGKNTVMGALLGAMLSMGVIVVAHLMNDTIMSSEDVERKLNLHVLGTLPLEDAELNDNQKSRKKHKRSATRK